MKRKSLMTLTAAVLAGMVCFAGCGKKEEAPAPVLEPIPQSEQVQTGQETPGTEAEQSGTTQAVSQEQSLQGQAVPGEKQEELFSTLSGLEFYFSSGAGGWRTVLHIDENGNFEGNYMDSDMGDTGENYPNGTVYACEFSGAFTEPVFVENGIYKMTIREISYAQKPDTTEIKDDMRFCYTSAYGLDEATDLYIYEPGIELSRLPDDYIGWVQMGLNGGSTLPFYGIYNKSAATGFSSYAAADTGDSSAKTASSGSSVSAQEMIDAIAQTEEKAAELQHEIETEDMSQLDYNFKTQDLYELWDSQLNQLWSYLQENLSADEMDRLTAEERNWIESKEKAVKEAGAPYEGGSIQPMIMNQKAAELTRERVLELQKKYL